MAQNRVIGRAQGLPWHIPADLKRFKEITLGHPVIMGRKTFESVGRPLPGRENIVVSRQTLSIPGVRVVTSVNEALLPFQGTDKEIFILGGGQIYVEALPITDRIYLTLIEENFEGDTYFPELDLKRFKQTFEEKHTKPIPFRFINYSR